METKELLKQNLIWKGSGYCPARHQRKKDDYCNNKVELEHIFCVRCECDIHDCKKQQTCEWPLLNRQVCSAHYSSKYVPEADFFYYGDF